MTGSPYREVHADPELAKLENHVNALGITQLALGIMGAASCVMLLFQGLFGGPGAQEVYTLLWSGELGMWMKLQTALGFVSALALVGVGAVTQKKRPFARPLSFAHGAFSLAVVALNGWLIFGVMVPLLGDFADSAGPVGTAALWGGIAGGSLGALFGLLFPILELWVMTRPRIREVLRG